MSKTRTSFKKGHTGYWLGKHLSKEHKERLSEAGMGKANNFKTGESIDKGKYNKQYKIDHRKQINEYQEKYMKQYYKDQEHILKHRLTSYKHTAKQRGLVWGITFDEFMKIISMPCYYCGGEGYGIDRLNSSVGYLRDNIVSCCSMCNYMKHTYTEEDFVRQCMKISNNWKGEYEL